MTTTRIWTAITLALMVLTVVSCGGSGEEDAAPVDQSATGGGEPVSAQVGDVPFAKVISSSGFKTVAFTDFTGQLPGRRTSALVYQAGSGKGGGVMYVLKDGGGPEKVVWHWYFEDETPDSVEAVEINGDGLWDVRVYMHDGKTRDFIQDETFTLVAPARGDRIAHNGEASPADGAWKCFDGDTTTAWVAPLKGNPRIDIPTPLGLDNGVMQVRLLDRDQPRILKLEADGKKLQEIELEQTTGLQRFRLDEAVKKARFVRVVVTSGYGADAVAVGELGLK